MTRLTGQRLARSSIRLYALIVLVYPRGFRAAFGDQMVQAFSDLVRDAWGGAGLIGLMGLWMRTIGDLLVSVLNAYAHEGREWMARAVAGTAILYLVALLLVLGYGAIRFSEFYEAPAFTRFGASAAASEDALIAGYEQALAGDFGRYRAFALGAGLVLAMLLGVGAALFGLWQRSLLQGAGALLGGAALTAAAVSLLPTIWFPLDRYPVSFVWVFRCFPIAVVAWIVVMTIGRFRSGLRFRAA